MLKPHFNKNTMKKRNPYLRLCLPSDMQNAWQQSIFFFFWVKLAPRIIKNTKKHVHEISAISDFFRKSYLLKDHKLFAYDTSHDQIDTHHNK